ncbi:MAG TPA: hypothetical protein VLX29_05405 [Nitrospirota bacterium]|nr:hypothetical protein [Nitrospirota bacterium]
MSKRRYNIHEAAKYLGRSVWALRKMYYHGKIPCVRDGHRMQLTLLTLLAGLKGTNLN